MEHTYRIISGTEEEKKIINSVIDYILKEYPENINIDKLKTIEIVDALDNDSSGRSIRDKILLPRKYALDGIKFNGSIENSEATDSNLQMLIGTIYHELWHITTWMKYEFMYEYVLDEQNSDVYTAFAYMYWIEYVAHMETVFMENVDVVKKFCEDFVCKKWHRIEYGYSYFVKALPYYLVRAEFLEIFEELTRKIVCDELRMAVYEFAKVSKELFQNDEIQEINKANIIKEMIVKLFE